MAEAGKPQLLSEFYKDRTIFVTGASGLMGKVLIEKILYSCPDIKMIYIMVRPKRGKTVEARVEEMFKLPMFARLRKEKPENLKKVVAFQGDVTLENLGMAEEARKRLEEEVSLVFHGAATLKLESNLRDAVEMNTSGTLRVIQLCKRMKKLQAFIHLSTAFCHVDHEVLEEKVYESPYEPMDIIKLVKVLDDKLLDKITPEMISPHPNTYTFSKRLAEKLVADYYNEMPMCIARPSIVTPAVEEPVQGWVDNLNGPTGILVAGGKGVLRSMYCKPEYNAEVIPVDFAIKAIIAVGRKVATSERGKHIPVFNLTQSKEKEVTWGEILETGKQLNWEYPFEMMLWYPDGNLRSNKMIHTICAFFLHWIPAYFIDFMMFLFRQKRFMVHVQTKISVGLEVLQYFTTQKWTFTNEEFLKIARQLYQEDAQSFEIDFHSIENKEYMKRCILGARQFCVKEPLESLPRARRTIKILYVADRILHFAVYMMFAYWIISFSETARYMFDVAGENIKNVPFIRSFATHAHGETAVPRY